MLNTKDKTVGNVKESKSYLDKWVADEPLLNDTNFNYRRRIAFEFNEIDSYYKRRITLTLHGMCLF